MKKGDLVLFLCSHNIVYRALIWWRLITSYFIFIYGYNHLIHNFVSFFSHDFISFVFVLHTEHFQTYKKAERLLQETATVHQDSTVSFYCTHFISALATLLTNLIYRHHHSERPPAFSCKSRPLCAKADLRF